MKKLIIIQWDMQLGPQLVIQYPPEEVHPSKDLLLKLWALHETFQETPFVEYEDGKCFYCSLLKYIENRTYFIILELKSKKDTTIFREILETVSDDLMNNLNQPQFPYLISDTYKMIKSYSDLNEFQLSMRLFEEKIRIDLFFILRLGISSKRQIIDEMLKRFGYKKVNLDLILAMFIRLNLVQITPTAGNDESVLLIQDLYGALLPMKQTNLPADIQSVVKKLFHTPQILADPSLQECVKLLTIPEVQTCLDKLSKAGSSGIKKNQLERILNFRPELIEMLKNFNILYQKGDQFWQITELQFFRFNPLYLITSLLDRYESNQITLEQLILHLNVLKTNINTENKAYKRLKDSLW
jgi:hypothetical protein